MNWTIIRIKLSNGFYRFDAVAPITPLDPSLDIEGGDGEIIRSGDYSIVATNYTDQQVDDFFATIEQQDARSA